MSTLLVILLVWALGVPALVFGMALTLPWLLRRRPDEPETAEIRHIFPAHAHPRTVVQLRARGHR